MKYPKSPFFLLVILFPPKKQKSLNLLKTPTYSTQPKSPQSYLQLFWFSVSQFPFRPREAPSCPETAAGWPRSCTFFFDKQKLCPKKVGWGFGRKKPERDFCSPRKKLPTNKRCKWGVGFFLGHRIDFFVFKRMWSETQSHWRFGPVGRWFFWISIFFGEVLGSKC